MRNARLVLMLLIVPVLFGMAMAQEQEQTEGTDGDEIPAIFKVELGAAGAGDQVEANDYGDTYTPEELAALDRALWAGNMTREDMRFKKDYTEGHGCFPIVKEMMHDPLRIAAWMDRFTAEFPESSELWADPAFGALSLVYDSATDLLPPIDRRPVDYHFYDSESSDNSQLIPEWLASNFDQDWGELILSDLTEEEARLLRSELPEAMAWHSFERSSGNTGYEGAKSTDSQGLFELALKASPVDPRVFGPSVDLPIGMELPKHMFTALMLLNFFNLTRDLPLVEASAWPADQPYYLDGEYGRICIGTTGDDYYEGDYVVLIEPGGNDTYHNCRIGAAYGKRSYGPKLSPDGQPVGASADYSPLGDGRLGYFVDLGGDDFYDCADVDITLGAAVLGVAAFYDLGGGDDRYYAGSCSLGAAMGGIATFYDDGGSDYYSGKVYTQGAAGFGIGIMIDDSVADAPVFDTAEGNDAEIDNYETGESDVDTHSLMDNDYYTAWSNAQAFARPRGVALCINRRGNEVYHAGGVYLHAPLFADRYQSFSQGFAIGERGIDWAGGIAMLIDYGGNDKYLGDVYNQGVGYWYGAGLLWDGGGNDLYEMTQYGQGSGIHLAVGGLVDVDGNDSYIMHSGLGQSGSHDLAASVLHDRGGNDRYHGSTSCNGGALTGSVALFFEREGNDTYAGRKGNGVNFADGRRINMGLFMDCGGDDDYLGVMDDDMTWRQGNIGMGIDVPPPPEPEVLEDASADTKEPEDAAGFEVITIPEICYFTGDLTQEVFDELWEISVRWEVGDNQYVVPVARGRLVDCGPDVLPYMSAVMDNSNSGLALRAYVDIFQALYEEHGDAVDAVLRENAASGEAEREKSALYLIGELKLTNLEYVVTGFFEHEDGSMIRRAIGVLGDIESHAADVNLIDMLNTDYHDEPMIKAALTTLTDLEVDCYDDLRPLLDYPLVSVREQLVKQLAAHWDVYTEQIELDITSITYMYWDVWPADSSDAELAVPMLLDEPSIRAQRSLLAILAGVDVTPRLLVRGAVVGTLAAGDWGVRGDAVRVVRHWQELAAEDEEMAERIAPVVVAMEEMLASETDPYVLFCAEQ